MKLQGGAGRVGGGLGGGRVGGRRVAAGGGGRQRGLDTNARAQQTRFTACPTGRKASPAAIGLQAAWSRENSGVGDAAPHDSNMGASTMLAGWSKMRKCPCLLGARCAAGAGVVDVVPGVVQRRVRLGPWHDDTCDWWIDQDRLGQSESKPTNPCPTW